MSTLACWFQDVFTQQTILNSWYTTRRVQITERVIGDDRELDPSQPALVPSPTSRIETPVENKEEEAVVIEMVEEDQAEADGENQVAEEQQDVETQPNEIQHVVALDETPDGHKKRKKHSKKNKQRKKRATTSASKSRVCEQKFTSEPTTNAMRQTTLAFTKSEKEDAWSVLETAWKDQWSKIPLVSIDRADMCKERRSKTVFIQFESKTIAALRNFFFLRKLPNGRVVGDAKMCACIQRRQLLPPPLLNLKHHGNEAERRAYVTDIFRHVWFVTSYEGAFCDELVLWSDLCNHNTTSQRRGLLELYVVDMLSGLSRDDERLQDFFYRMFAAAIDHKPGAYLTS